MRTGRLQMYNYKTLYFARVFVPRLSWFYDRYRVSFVQSKDVWVLYIGHAATIPAFEK